MHIYKITVIGPRAAHVTFLRAAAVLICVAKRYLQLQILVTCQQLYWGGSGKLEQTI